MTSVDPITRPEGIAVSFNTYNIATIENGKTNVLTDTDKDFKPVSSADGKHLTFFRIESWGDGASFLTWKTKLCVINWNGTGFRELTSGEFSDFNPTFTRDGTNRIIFNRYNRHGTDGCEIFVTTLDASPGDEQKISHPTIDSYEWVYSSLKDGRLFVHRIETKEREVYFLDPNPGSLGEYQRISMPSSKHVHKANISPSETKITYMLDHDDDWTSYEDVQIAWAKLDVPGLRVYDEKTIAERDPKIVVEYPKWNHDETVIIYDSNKLHGGGLLYQLYAYRLSDGVEENITPDNDLNYQVCSIRGIPK